MTTDQAQKIPEQYISGLQYAGFWRRFVACIIDGIAILIVMIPVILAFYFIQIPKELADALTGTSILSQIIQSAIYPALVSLVIATSWQTSPGKRLMNAFIIDKGGKINYVRAFIRTSLLSFIIILVGIVFNPYDAKPEQGAVKAMEYHLYGNFPEARDVLLKNNLSFEEYMSPDRKVSEWMAVDAQFEQILSKKGAEGYKRGRDALDKVQLEYSLTSLQKIVPYFVIIFGLLIVWHLPIIFTKQKTAMHDIILGTRVIKGKAEDYYGKNENTQTV